MKEMMKKRKKKMMKQMKSKMENKHLESEREVFGWWFCILERL